MHAVYSQSWLPEHKSLVTTRSSRYPNVCPSEFDRCHQIARRRRCNFPQLTSATRRETRECHDPIGTFDIHTLELAIVNTDLVVFLEH